MEQSNVIFAAFFLVFLIYIIMKGELPTYLGFLKPNTSAVGGSGNPSSAMTGQADTVQGQGAFAGQTLGPDITLFGHHTGTTLQQGPANSLNPFTLFGLFQ